MLKTSHVVKFIGQLFPYRKALSGDRVGLIYGSPHKPVEKVISALDLTPEVMDQAVREQCDLIIVHHPFLYEVSLDLEWQKAPYKHLIHKRLVNTGIGLLVAHTNYDLIWQGMSEQVVDTLSFASVRAIGTYRAGAILTTNLSMYQIFELIKRKLGIEIFRSNFTVPKNTRSDEHKIAILPGASDVRDILLAHQQGAQTILTSDVKWSTWLVCEQQNIRLVSLSHSIENVFADHISALLNQKFPKLTCLSQKINVQEHVSILKN